MRGRLELMQWPILPVRVAARQMSLVSWVPRRRAGYLTAADGRWSGGSKRIKSSEEGRAVARQDRVGQRFTKYLGWVRVGWRSGRWLGVRNIFCTDAGKRLAK